MPHDDAVQFTQEFWDERYRTADQLWSGQPNPQLIAQAAGLAPGEALDAGCGEGADAIWLAGRGWAVTGADVSAVALERLPQVVLAGAQCDLLVDEAREFARRLRRQGRAVSKHVHPGMPHDFMLYAGRSASAAQATEQLIALCFC